MDTEKYLSKDCYKIKNNLLRGLYKPVYFYI